MRQVVLPGTSLNVSRFIFGTASLFNAGSGACRQRLLDAAVDHGLTHFDTAPYYGFGVAERDLSIVLRRNANVTVTTKVGIYSPGGEDVTAAMVFFRKAAGRFIPVLSRPEIDLSVSRAKTSLEASLRRLGRDHIDLYMLHEPDLPNLAADEFLGWLESEVTRGCVRSFGIASTADRIEPFLKAASPLAAVMQTTDSLEGREADVVRFFGRPLQITYGYISDAMRRGGAIEVPDILARALKRNTSGAIIVSTRRPERMGLYATLAASDRATDDRA